MARTPVDCAHRLLGVFVAFDRRADECLRPRSLMGAFDGPGWRAEDRDAGLELCLEREWVRMGPNGGVCVTPAGLDEIGA